MLQRGSPTRGFLVLTRVPAIERPERRALLLLRGIAAAVMLALYTVAGVLAAVLALLPIVRRPVAGRRVPVAVSEDAAGSSWQAHRG